MRYWKEEIYSACPALPCPALCRFFNGGDHNSCIARARKTFPQRLQPMAVFPRQNQTTSSRTYTELLLSKIHARYGKGQTEQPSTHLITHP